jgi:5-formyltetrahydrofolate cyclo-ligase
VRKTKEQIRKELLGKLNIQAREKALKKSDIIKTRLFSLPEFKKSKLVMLYASKTEEVATDSMIDEALKMGKRVALPRCTSQRGIVPKEIRNRHTDLEKGIYAIRQPRIGQKSLEPEKINLVVVPGVAFDEKNRRLGRGKGYYDRFLKKLPGNSISVGLAFDFQIVENLPEDSHDIPVSKVITDI